MRAEFVNPFLAPAKHVWQRELGHELDLEEYDTDMSQVTTEDITAVIRVKGLVEGHVLYGFDLETAREVAGVMIGEELSKLDDIAISAIGELANMISGNAAAQLSAAGYSCKISPPLVFKSSGIRFTDDHIQQIVVVFDSDLGPLYVRISLAERPDDDTLAWAWQQMYRQARYSR